MRLLSGSSGGVVVGESGEEGEEGRGDEINPLLLDPTQWKVKPSTVLRNVMMLLITGSGPLRLAWSG